MSVSAVGSDLQCRACVKDCVVQAIFAEVKIAKTNVSRVVLWIDREGVRPKSAAITPVTGLFPGGKHQEGDWGGHRRAEKKASMAPRGDSVGNEPRHKNIQTDLGQVHVAIRVGLLADLYDTAYRHHHSQKPKPAGQKIGMSPSAHESSCADRDKEQRCHQDLQDRKAVPRMKVKNGQSKWPHEL